MAQSLLVKSCTRFGSKARANASLQTQCVQTDTMYRSRWSQPAYINLGVSSFSTLARLSFFLGFT